MNKSNEIPVLPKHTAADVKTIELTSIREARGEETPRFSATLKVNGIAVCHVGNGGTGGCNEYNPIGWDGIAIWNSWADALEEYARKLPPVMDDNGQPMKCFDGSVMLHDLDMVVFNLLDKKKSDKQRSAILKKCKTHLIFVEENAPKGSYYTQKHPNGLLLDQSKVPAAIKKAMDSGVFKKGTVFANTDPDTFFKLVFGE